jgi:type VI secretion system protein VasJ
MTAVADAPPDLGRRPIPGDAPAGRDVSSDPRYEELSAEVARAASAESAGSADWDKVRRLATELLETSAKDLRVAGAWALAMTRTRGEDGFLEGANVVLDLVDHHWEGLFPPKTRPLGRARALEWWIARTTAALSASARFDARTAEALRERLRTTGAFLRDALPEAPSFAAITVLLDASTQTPTISSRTEPLNNREATSTPPPPEDASTLAARARDGLWRAAGDLATRDVADPRLYHWNRFGLWMDITAAPPMTEGRTLVPPPSADLRTRFQILRSAGDAEALRKDAEDQTFQFPFWFDLHRYVWEALSALGENHRSAADAVRSDTAAFWARCPGAPEGLFADGTPFADEETRRWAAPTPAPAPGAEDATDDDLNQVKRAFARGAAAEGARRVEAALRSRTSARDRLLWRAECLAVLPARTPASLVVAFADRLATELDAHRVAAFDPDLALKACTAAYRALKNRREKESGAEADRWLRRIAEIDLEAFTKEGGTHVGNE